MFQYVSYGFFAEFLFRAKLHDDQLRTTLVFGAVFAAIVNPFSPE
jgi:hypothetical protein